MASDLVGAESRIAAERCDFAVRCFVMLSVAGELLTDLGTWHRQTVSAVRMTADALTELVALSQRVADAVAGLDRWETAILGAPMQQTVRDSRSYRDPPAAVGPMAPPAESITQAALAEARPIRDRTHNTPHLSGEHSGNGHAAAQPRPTPSVLTSATGNGSLGPHGSVDRTQYGCGRRSRGRTWLSIKVHAFCECGWATRWHHWAAPPGAAKDALAETDAALTEHQANTGHRQYRRDGLPQPDGYHMACGWFHDFQDCCPAPPTSPTGRVNRTCAALSARGTAGALDQLAAIAELRHWLDEQETHGIIQARIAGSDWTCIAAAVAADTADVQRRWGPLIRRYEASGLLRPPPSDEARRTT